MLESPLAAFGADKWFKTEKATLTNWCVIICINKLALIPVACQTVAYIVPVIEIHEPALTYLQIRPFK